MAENQTIALSPGFNVLEEAGSSTAMDVTAPADVLAVIVLEEPASSRICFLDTNFTLFIVVGLKIQKSIQRDIRCRQIFHLKSLAQNITIRCFVLVIEITIATKASFTGVPFPPPQATSKPEAVTTAMPFRKSRRENSFYIFIPPAQMFKLRRRFCLFNLSKSSTLCFKISLFVFCILFSPHNLYKAGFRHYT